MIDTEELRETGQVVLTLANKLISAAKEIDELRDFAIWLTGCGYEFCQHKYFIERRDKLLKGINAAETEDPITQD